jgi:hypothetical protein
MTGNMLRIREWHVHIIVGLEGAVHATTRYARTREAEARAHAKPRWWVNDIKVFIIIQVGPKSPYEWPNDLCPRLARIDTAKRVEHMCELKNTKMSTTVSRLS